MINIWMIYANGGERADVVAFNWPICELHPNLSECFLGPLHTRRECGGGGGDFTHQKRKKYIKNAGNHPCFCSSQGKRRSSDGRGRPRRGARRLKTQNEIPGGTEATSSRPPLSGGFYLNSPFYFQSLTVKKQKQTLWRVWHQEAAGKLQIFCSNSQIVEIKSVWFEKPTGFNPLKQNSWQFLHIYALKNKNVWAKHI